MPDPEIQKRNRANKRRGATFETDLVKELRRYYPQTERLTKNGRDDQGDLIVVDGGYSILVEAKTGKLSPSQFLREAEVERENYLKARPTVREETVESVAVWKQPGKSIREAVVLTTVEDYFDLKYRSTHDE